MSVLRNVNGKSLPYHAQEFSPRPPGSAIDVYRNFDFDLAQLVKVVHCPHSSTAKRQEDVQCWINLRMFSILLKRPATQLTLHHLIFLHLE